MTMLVAVITNHESYTRKQIQDLCVLVDACEFRLDYFSSFEIAKLAEFKQLFTVPIIFTLRKKSHGGKYRLSEKERLLDIEKIALLQPDYIDIECDTNREFTEYLSKKHSSIKLICSYHNFDETPKYLEDVLSNMFSDNIHSYKIATHANSSLDALRMLYFTRENSIQLNLTGICMGHSGEFSRILSPIFGSQFCYSFSSNEHVTAPGQVNIDDLLSIYNFRNLNDKTRVYCLTGNSVKYSSIHILHNRNFHSGRKNSVCVKINISKDELKDFIAHSKAMRSSTGSLRIMLV